MRVIGPSSEEEMVLAFLSAEIYSPRYKDIVRKALGGNLALVYRPQPVFSWVVSPRVSGVSVGWWMRAGRSLAQGLRRGAAWAWHVPDRRLAVWLGVLGV